MNFRRSTLTLTVIDSKKAIDVGKLYSYCFDIDGTICTNTDGNYQDARPYMHRIDYINMLYDEGHTITIFTARGATSGINWHDFTVDQLDEWGVRYHVLRTDKPHYDVMIDDKAVHDASFFLYIDDIDMI